MGTSGSVIRPVFWNIRNDIDNGIVSRSSKSLDDTKLVQGYG